MTFVRVLILFPLALLITANVVIGDGNEECFESNVTRQDQEVWAKSACEVCICKNGNVKCTTQYCPELKGCVKKHTPYGECCQVCLHCHFGPTRRIMQHGEKEYPNPCLVCECIAGSINCTTKQCPENNRACFNPTFYEHSCCPTCDYGRNKNGCYNRGDYCVKSYDREEECLGSVKHRCCKGQVCCGVPKEEP